VVHFTRLWQFTQRLCCRWHIAAITARYMLMDYRPSHSKIPQIWRTSFYLDGCYCTDRSFEMANFQKEKRIRDH
jgi:hypothetical protein